MYNLREEIYLLYHCNLLYILYQNIELIGNNLLSYSPNYSNFIMIVSHFLSNFSVSNYCRRSTIGFRVTVTARNSIPNIDYNRHRVIFCLPTKLADPDLKLTKSIANIQKVNFRCKIVIIKFEGKKLYPMLDDVKKIRFEKHSLLRHLCSKQVKWSR